MNRSKSFSITIILLLGWFSIVKAQQVFPVQVTGTLIPPNSLALSDYANSRSMDIMFMLTLRDPIEASRLVKFRLTIKNNGSEILVTNPNFNPSPILLERDVPVMIDGGDLAVYFNTSSLIGSNGQPGGLLLPEGFNEICLEVIDLERNVSISQQFCLRGMFENSDPPILNMPICDAVLPWTETQNMIFNWFPQHLSSSNPPIAVEYEITIVQVLEGQNPNDAFLASFPIIKETVFVPSYLYLEGDPLLEPNVLYAWRVQAIDASGAATFDNGGYSKVCTFSFQENNIQPAPNPTYGCEGGPCNWEGALSNLDYSDELKVGDSLRIGYFSVKVSEVSGSNASGYQGEGTVYVPFLYSRLKVEFSNIKVNEQRRIYEGEVTSIASTQQNLIPALFDVSNMEATLDEIAEGFSDEAAAALEQYFDPSALGSMNLVSKLQNEVTPEIILPIGLDQFSEDMNLPITIAITGVKFDPTTARMNAILSFRLTENSDWIKFGVNGVCLQPNGLSAGNGSLNLLTDVEIGLGDFKTTILGISENGLGSYLSWNCEGFDEFFIQGKYTFDQENFKNLSNPEQPVVASFNTSTRSLNDILISVDPIDKFVIVGLEDFEFETGNIIMDLSKSRNPVAINFPEGYENTNNDWNGLLIENIDLTLPKELSFRDDDQPIVISGQNMLVDNFGVSGKVIGTNSLQVSSDAFGDWGLSIDTIGASFLKNDFKEAFINGGINLPLVAEPIKYEGNLTYDASDKSYSANLRPKNDITVGMDIGPKNGNEYLASLTVYAESEGSQTEIRADYKNGHFEPQATICGGIQINVDEATIRNYISDDIMDIITNMVGDFSFNAAFDICLNIDPSPQENGKFFDLISYDGSLTIPGLDPISLDNSLNLTEFMVTLNGSDLGNIKLAGYGGVDLDTTNWPNISNLPQQGTFTGVPDFNIPSVTLPDFSQITSGTALPNQFRTLGFNFNMPSIPGINLTIGAWVTQDMASGSSSFDFSSFVFDVKTPEVQCDVTDAEKFSVGNSSIYVPFLSKSFNVTEVNGIYKTVSGNQFPFNLVDEIGDILPFSIDSSFLTMGIDPTDIPDFEIEGIEFRSNGTAVMVANLSIKLGSYNFELVGRLPIHPQGIYFNEVKIGFKNDIEIGF